MRFTKSTILLYCTTFIRVMVLSLCFQLVCQSYADAKPKTPAEYLEKGQASYDQFDFKNALDNWSEGYSLATRSRDRGYEAKFLLNIGTLYKSVAQYEMALSSLEQALAIYQSISHMAGQGNARVEIGKVYRMRGQYEMALSSLEQALAIYQSISDMAGQGEALRNIGIVYRMLGQYEMAISTLKQALAIYQSIPDMTGEAAVLVSIGNVDRWLGQYEMALSCFEQALAIHRKIHSPVGEGVDLANIGIVYRMLSHYEMAISSLEQALAIQRDIPDRAGEGADLASIGKVYLMLGQYEMAISCFGEALTIQQDIGDRAGEGEALCNLGILHVKLGNYAEGLHFFELALKVAEEVAEPETLWRVFNGLQQSHQKLSNPQAAVFFGKQAVNTLQTVRGGIISLDRKIQESFMIDKLSVYEDLASLLIDEGRLAEARTVLAMLKEEEYFDFIRGRSEEASALTRISFTRNEEHWKARQAKVSKNFHEIARDHAKLVNKQKLGLTQQEKRQLAELEKELDLASRDFDKYLEDLKRDFKETPRQREREFPEQELKALWAFKGTLEELGPGTAAVYFLSTENQLRIILIDGNLSRPEITHDSPIGEEQLNRLIYEYGTTLRNRWKNPLPEAQLLYKHIFGKIEKDLLKIGAKTLLVYLDGALRYLPLAALHDGTQYVAQSYGLVLYTPAAKDKLKDRPRVPLRVAGFGVSEAFENFLELKFVRDEVDWIVKETPDDPLGVLPGISYLNKEFTSACLSEVLLKEEYPVVHIASHFKFVPGTLADSFLLLGSGEKLSLTDFAPEKYRLTKVDLLTLSACETGLGDTAGADGREVEGFGALAQNRGAKAVLATLWKVADRSTSLFMQSFYQLRDEKKLTKAEALRLVQVKFISGQITDLAAETSKKRAAWVLDPESDIIHAYAHPYYWAPFILMGNFL